MTYIYTLVWSLGNSRYVVVVEKLEQSKFRAFKTLMMEGNTERREGLKYHDIYAVVAKGFFFREGNFISWYQHFGYDLQNVGGTYKI